MFFLFNLCQNISLPEYFLNDPNRMDIRSVLHRNHYSVDFRYGIAEQKIKGSVNETGAGPNNFLGKPWTWVFCIYVVRRWADKSIGIPKRLPYGMGLKR